MDVDLSLKDPENKKGSEPKGELILAEIHNSEIFTDRIEHYDKVVAFRMPSPAKTLVKVCFKPVDSQYTFKRVIGVPLLMSVEEGETAQVLKERVIKVIRYSGSGLCSYELHICLCLL